jgi:hypothetical protein
VDQPGILTRFKEIFDKIEDAEREILVTITVGCATITSMPTHFPSSHPVRVRTWNELYLPSERIQNISGHVWPTDAESGRPFTLYCADFSTLSAFMKLVEPTKHGAWLHSQTQRSPHLTGLSEPKGTIKPPRKDERKKKE